MMDNSIGWDKIRLLVTNACNYKCAFCHNEGQAKHMLPKQMSYEQLKQFIDIIKEQKISEICFSGGEPFLNKDIVKMIVYANNETACDIGCASNLSLITESQIQELAKTRVKLNIQFPYANEDDFRRSTVNGKYSAILKKIDSIRSAGIEIGLNTVIQSTEIENIKEIIRFALIQEIPLKLLPQIGQEGSEKYKDSIYPLLRENAVDCKDKGSGATRWILKSNGHQTVVLYIDSPCFYKDISVCRHYGEIRILPDMSAQTCILKNQATSLEFDEGKEYVLNQLQELWKSFSHC